jgi:hypothetical protein
MTTRSGREYGSVPATVTRKNKKKKPKAKKPIQTTLKKRPQKQKEEMTETTGYRTTRSGRRYSTTTTPNDPQGVTGDRNGDEGNQPFDPLKQKKQQKIPLRPRSPPALPDRVLQDSTNTRQKTPTTQRSQPPEKPKPQQTAKTKRSTSLPDRPECTVYILEKDALQNRDNATAQHFLQQIGAGTFDPSKKRQHKKQKNCFESLCQREVRKDYTKTAIAKCRYIIVATIEDAEKRALYVQAMRDLEQRSTKENSERNKRIQKLLNENESSCKKVVAFLVVADHTRKHEIYDIPEDQWKPVCKPNQLYLDVVCALPGFGCGQTLLKALKDLARKTPEITSIALSSVSTAIPYWEKQGFTHCPEDQLVCTLNGQKQKERANGKNRCKMRPVLKDAPQWGFQMNTCI